MQAAAATGHNRGLGERAHGEGSGEKKGGSSGGNVCKKVMKFLFSHIGLCGMVFAYAIAGGFIFMHLEQTNEKQQCINARAQYLPKENDTTNKLWQISTLFTTDDDMSYALIEYQKVLRDFRDSVVSIGWDTITNCDMMGEDGGPAYAWSLPGAILFSVTVFTTIGYGNIAPKTFWGRLVCIAYAVLGIPLMLLCLSNIGDALANVFRFTYTKACCCGCCRRKPNKRQPTAAEQGLPDKNQPQNPPGGVSSSQNSMEAWKAQFEASQQAQRAAAAAAAAGAGSNSDEANLVDDYDDDDEDEDEEVSVPVTVTVAIIGVYVFLGALLFSVWEEWDWLKSAYYCFITIATIGFGDVVPGTSNLNTLYGQLQMLGAAFYILFGMAIISMCFNLIQEEIVGKFHWIAQKFGMAHKTDDDDGAMTDDVTDDGGPMTSPGSGVTQRTSSNINDDIIRRRMMDEMGKGKGDKGVGGGGTKGRGSVAPSNNLVPPFMGKKPAPAAAGSGMGAKQPAPAAPNPPATPTAWE